MTWSWLSVFLLQQSEALAGQELYINTFTGCCPAYVIFLFLILYSSALLELCSAKLILFICQTGSLIGLHRSEHALII